MPDNSLHSGHRERMRTRFRTHNDLEGFAEHEVLEMLLFNILPRVNTNEIAHRLLKKFGNIRTVLTASVTDLCQVQGVGIKCAEQLTFLGQVFRRAERESFLTVQADDIENLSAYLRNFFYADQVERLCAFSVNDAGKVSGCSVLSVGISDKVNFDIDELKRFLLYNDSKSLVLSHNHPFGKSEPSPEDIALTRQLYMLLDGKAHLIDHVIVGADGVSSMRMMGYFRAFE
ncbi:JAB domain-containing protein [Ruminococcus sp.]|uniref:JAB domain-containing protein n=1 Tax=Ruminococcus sp. TaxID=41978 RepID=UPI0025D66DA9|nr:JAB domain-containing protein [Ruminococcus sp.]MBQ9543372.1 RadC family protein [Ruminococcus sp.]